MIAVSDFGIGIPISINNYLKKRGESYLSDKEAIQKSFMRGFTTKSKPHNRGLGLDTLKTIVKKLNGRMTLVTGNTVYYQTKSGEEKYRHIENYRFEGTTLAIFLDTTYLEAIESEHLEEEFCL